MCPAASGFTRTGGNGGNATTDPVNGPQPGGTGGYISNGLLPPTPNTGGTGGGFTQSTTAPAANGGAGHPGYVVLTVLSGPAVSASTQQLQVFSGNSVGQTINGAASYASLTCAGSVLTVHVSLSQTNQPNASFQIFYKLDNGAPVASAVFIATDGSGNGTASFNIPNITAG